MTGAGVHRGLLSRVLTEEGAGDAAGYQDSRVAASRAAEEAA